MALSSGGNQPVENQVAGFRPIQEEAAVVGEKMTRDF